MTTYHAYGLDIFSEVPFPEFPEKVLEKNPDLEITYGHPPVSLDEPKTVGFKFEGNADSLLIKTDKIARILVTKGCRMIIEPLPGAPDHQVRYLAAGWGLGAVLQQRNVVALHGSVICDRNKGFVICAPSGIGKSTLTAAFTQRGYWFLDDNIAVFSGSGKRPVVMPGHPQIKLWDDALEKLDIDNTSEETVFSTVRKFPVSFVERFCCQPTEVLAVYLLFPHQEGTWDLTPVTGHIKLNLLLSQLFCGRFIPNLRQHAPLISTLIRIANSLEVIRVNLPEKNRSPYETADRIENDFRTRSKR